MALTEHPGRKDRPESMELPDRKAPPEPMALTEQLARRDHLEPMEHPGRKDRREPMALTEQPGRKDRPDLPELMAPVARWARGSIPEAAARPF